MHDQLLHNANKYGFYTDEIDLKVKADYLAVKRAAYALGPESPEAVELLDAACMTIKETLFKYSAPLLLKCSKQWYSWYDADDACAIAAEAFVKAADKWIDTDFKYHWMYHLKQIVRARFHSTKNKRVSDQLVKYSYDEYSSENPEPAYMKIKSDVSLDGLYEPKVKNGDMPNVVLEVMKDCTTETEYNFLYDIYFNGQTLTAAGQKHFDTSRMGSSGKHRRLLAKINSVFSKQLNIHDITDIISLSF